MTTITKIKISRYFSLLFRERLYGKDLFSATKNRQLHFCTVVWAVKMNHH